MQYESSISIHYLYSSFSLKFSKNESSPSSSFRMVKESEFIKPDFQITLFVDK